MARPGNQNHKKRYEKYKNSGRKAENKRLRAERNQKRIERFKKRREEGKAYVYKPNPFEPGTPEHIREASNRRRKNVNHKTEYQMVTSMMRKLQNELNRIAKEEKRAMEKTRKGKSQQSSPQNNVGEQEIGMYKM